MTYIESVLADFIKSILTRGIKTLKSERFFPYTAVLLIIVIFSTIASFFSGLLQIDLEGDFVDLVLYIELSAALAFIFVGTLLGRQSAKIQLPLIILIISSLSLILYMDVFGSSSEFSLYLGAILYIAWIAITTFSTFSLFKDLFGNNIFGTILFLGKQEDDGRALFSFLGIILAMVNIAIGYFLFTQYGDTTPVFFTSLVIILYGVFAIFPLLNLQRKNDVFFSILNFFYMFSTIKVFLLAFRIISQTGGETSFWDTIFSMFMALYAIQGAAVKGVKIAAKNTDLTLEEQLLEESEDLGFSRTVARILSDRGIVLVILGVLLGFHSMQVQAVFGRRNIFSDIELFAGSDIVILGYEFSILISLSIFLISLLLFLLLPGFRRYANPEVNRVPWAPDYDDLKAMLAGIKSGDISWKGDAAKLAMGLATDKLKEKFGLKKDKNAESRMKRTFGKWLNKE